MPSGITVRLLKEENSSSGVVVSPYLGQDYHKLVQECLQQGRLFEDPHFPADAKSLGYNELGPWSAVTRGIQWKRPQEICQSPKFITENMKWTDVCQGQLGNCWFLAAAASLTQYPLLMARVVPPQQGFKDRYVGIFHFQFWQYGEWVDVVVDDRLPVKNGQLVFVSSAQESEFWAALLEKAYAKLNGSYEALNGGFMNEAFVDFTGGLDETVDLKVPPPNLYHLIEKAVKKRSLMGASIQIQSQYERELTTPEGLVKGHAYSIIATWKMEQNGRTIHLLRLRNPWGKVEWNGRWSDNSPLWSQVTFELREKMQVRGEDGEFWMQMEDFLRFFDILEVCNLTPESMKDKCAHLWNTNTFSGRWMMGHNAGGCRNYRATFWTNPQYIVTLTEEDEDSSDGCTLLVSLMQKNRRQYRSRGQDFLVVGFEIYQVPKEFDNKMCASERKNLFSSLVSVASCSFMDERDVTGRYQLPPGRYLLIPSTFQPHQESDFIMRIFTEKQHTFIEIDCEIRANGNVFKENALKDTMEEFSAQFARLSGEDQEISPEELQRILIQITSKNTHLKTNGFSLDICRKLVKMVDLNCNGKLQLEEFRKLWSKIKEWEKIFTNYDKDRSGTMDVQELCLALEAAGFTLNNQLVESLCQKYGNNVRQVYFDSFLSCLAYLVCVFEQCRIMDKNKDGVICISKEEASIYIKGTIYLHLQVFLLNLSIILFLLLCCLCLLQSCYWLARSFVIIIST
uniref:Calpain-2 catalytic subunit n=1 Tax=Xenopus tropicalis TaxID=8364 RepID=A0A803JV56_XENTR